MKTHFVNFLFLMFCFSCCKKPNTILPIENFIFDLSNKCDGTMVYDPQNPFQQDVYANNYKYVLQVNPNDPNEILYYTKYKTDHKLVIYNRTTSSENVILQKEMVFGPKWGRTGYIMFNDVGKLFTVKSNGDSLLPRVNAKNNFQWNFTGTRYLFETYDSNISKKINVIADIFTGEMDTLDNHYINIHTWLQKENLMIQYSSDQTDFNLINPDNSNLIKIKLPFDPHRFSIIDIEWISDHEILYASGQFIQILNINSGKVSNLVKFCLNNNPVCISYCDVSNEVFVLIKKSENIPGSDEILLSTPKVFIFDLDDNKMSEIVF